MLPEGAETKGTCAIMVIVTMKTEHEYQLQHHSERPQDCSVCQYRVN